MPTSLAGQAIALVHSRIEARLSPTELAGDLAISLRTLERGLAAELGCTPRQLISAMKMREARRMLVSGKYRVNEVAMRLGFATPSHFSRCFRTFLQDTAIGVGASSPHQPPRRTGEPPLLKVLSHP